MVVCNPVHQDVVRSGPIVALSSEAISLSSTPMPVQGVCDLSLIVSKSPERDIVSLLVIMLREANDMISV